MDTGTFNVIKKWTELIGVVGMSVEKHSHVQEKATQFTPRLMSKRISHPQSFQRVLAIKGNKIIIKSYFNHEIADTQLSEISSIKDNLGRSGHNKDNVCFTNEVYNKNSMVTKTNILSTNTGPFTLPLCVLHLIVLFSRYKREAESPIKLTLLLDCLSS